MNRPRRETETYEEYRTALKREEKQSRAARAGVFVLTTVSKKQKRALDKLIAAKKVQLETK